MRAWRLLLVVTALVVAGACGNSSSGAGGPTAKDAAGRPMLPIGAGSGGLASARESAAMADGGMAASMIAPARFVEYRLAKGAEAPARRAAAYRVVRADGNADDAAGSVAKALDVEPDKVEVQQGLGWYYSANRDGSVSSGAAVVCNPDRECPEPVRPPLPPGVPTADEAQTRFQTMLEKLGADTDEGTFEAQNDAYEVRQVTFRPAIDGIETEGFESSIAFGENGRIEYANGFLGRFEKVGDYPLIDLAASLQRQSNGFGGGVQTSGGPLVDPAITSGAEAEAPPQPQSTVVCAKGEPCTVSPTPVEPPRPVEPPSAPGDEPTMTIEPQSSEPTVPLEPEIVEITGGELVLQTVYGNCPEDEIFLVPAFRLLPLERAGFSIVAVEDDSLVGADRGPDVEPAPDPCEGRIEPDVPVGKPEPAPLPPERDATEPDRP